MSKSSAAKLAWSEFYRGLGRLLGRLLIVITVHLLLMLLIMAYLSWGFMMKLAMVATTVSLVVCMVYWGLQFFIHLQNSNEKILAAYRTNIVP